MKKLACFFLVICFSLSAYATKNNGRKYTASLDNSSVVKAQKEQRIALRNFGRGRKFASVTRHGIHIFGRRGSKASRPESGLGL